jgi:hypothetical protein
VPLFSLALPVFPLALCVCARVWRTPVSRTPPDLFYNRGMLFRFECNLERAHADFRAACGADKGFAAAEVSFSLTCTGASLPCISSVLEALTHLRWPFTLPSLLFSMSPASISQQHRSGHQTRLLRWPGRPLAPRPRRSAGQSHCAHKNNSSTRDQTRTLPRLLFGRQAGEACRRAEREAGRLPQLRRVVFSRHGQLSQLHPPIHVPFCYYSVVGNS